MQPFELTLKSADTEVLFDVEKMRECFHDILPRPPAQRPFFIKGINEFTIHDDSHPSGYSLAAPNPGSQQAKIIAVLVKNYSEAEQGGMLERDVLEQADIRSPGSKAPVDTNISEIFKHSPLWNVVIGKVKGKPIYYLKLKPVQGSRNGEAWLPPAG